jgi:hypothetical protein
MMSPVSTVRNSTYQDRMRSREEVKAPEGLEKFARGNRAALQFSGMVMQCFDCGVIIKMFLPGFYAWATKQVSKPYDKDKALKIAEERQAIMLSYLDQHLSIFMEDSLP